MDQLIYWQLLTADPIGSAKTGLRFIHFIGLALGLGAATLLDLMLLKFFVKKGISAESWEIFHFSARIVNVGLVILWLTGIGFIVHYALFDPVKLTNMKIWAKMSIVVILTINGLFIHGFIMPHLKRQIGKPLFQGMSQARRVAFLVSGAISVTSWYIPVVLGAFPQFNFTVPLVTILLSYALLIGAAALTMHLMLRWLDPDKRPSSDSAMPYLPGLSFT